MGISNVNLVPVAIGVLLEHFPKVKHCSQVLGCVEHVGASFGHLTQHLPVVFCVDCTLVQHICDEDMGHFHRSLLHLVFQCTVVCSSVNHADKMNPTLGSKITTFQKEPHILEWMVPHTWSLILIFVHK